MTARPASSSTRPASSHSAPPVRTGARRARKALGHVAVIGMAISLAACGAGDRLANIGKAPDLSAINNPVESPDYKPVSMPMPPVRSETRAPASLWRAGARAFFDDQRAKQVGDILTVKVTINDRAQLNNRTNRSRQNSESIGLDGFFGLENQLGKVLAEPIDPGSLVDLGSATSNVGQGGVQRTEAVTVSIAAVVTQILPNGNMVINGRQEMRVNYEVREILVAGVIRPEDIAGDNSVPHDKIAEARIAYGGRGQITDFQQPRYGSQVMDIILPF